MIVTLALILGAALVYAFVSGQTEESAFEEVERSLFDDLHIKVYGGLHDWRNDRW